MLPRTARRPPACPIRRAAACPSTPCSSPTRITRRYSLDLQEQVDIYNALPAAVNSAPRVDGFISRGYYPPARGTQIRLDPR